MSGILEYLKSAMLVSAMPLNNVGYYRTTVAVITAITVASSLVELNEKTLVAKY